MALKPPTPLPAVDLLFLMGLPRVGRHTAREIGQRLSERPTTTDNWRAALDSAAGSIQRFTTPDATTIQQAHLAAAAVVEQSVHSGIAVIGINDSAFPQRLLSIPDPPLVVFVKGHPGALSMPQAVAVIGTRSPSPRGSLAAERIGAFLGSRGIAVVSGLALGCDTSVHRGTVTRKGIGVAVLAHGLHTVSPASNRSLAEDIVAQGGCLISEYPPGQGPQRRYYVERDRLQSGLSDALLLVEAEEGSGSMHTVGFAIEQKRRIGCLRFDGQETLPTANAALLTRGDVEGLLGPSDISQWIKRIYEKTDAPSEPPAAIVSHDEHASDPEVNSSVSQKELPF